MEKTNIKKAEQKLQEWENFYNNISIPSVSHYSDNYWKSRKEIIKCIEKDFGVKYVGFDTFENSKEVK